MPYEPSSRHPSRIPARLGALLSALALLGSPTVALASDETWELRKQEAGIDVYTRSVPGSDIEEFRGEGLVEAEPGEILAVLRDANRFKDWFPNTSESMLLKRDGDVSYRYSVMSTPWPISDRDNVLRSVTTRDDATGRVDIQIEAAPDAHPVQDGRHRVRKARGSWRLTPEGGGRTFVSFTMHLEPGGGIPDWMVNARVVGTPFEAIVNLRETVAADRSR